MEERSTDICQLACSEDFSCHWEKLGNRFQYIFPDGTLQSCVGAQVRCGCTLYLRLISNVTYEHPTALSLTVIFVITIICYLFLRWFVFQQSYSVFCCTQSSINQVDKANALPSPRDFVLQVLHSNNYQPSFNNPTSPNSMEHDVHIVQYTEKPPAYSAAILKTSYDDNIPPPSYAECVEKNNFVQINYI